MGYIYKEMLEEVERKAKHYIEESIHEYRSSYELESDNYRVRTFERAYFAELVGLITESEFDSYCERAGIENGATPPKFFNIEDDE